MNVLRLLSIFIVCGLLVAACRSSHETAGGGTAEGVPSDSGEVYSNAVHVLVDGSDRGVVPQTVRVRRSFGTRKVSLWKAGEEIRTYEIEITSTTEGDQLLSGFWSTNSMEGRTYDVRTLPTEGDSTFVIPYAPYPLKVEDHSYGVTLLVGE